MSRLTISREEAAAGIKTLGFIGPHTLTHSELMDLTSLVAKLDRVMQSPKRKRSKKP